MWVKIFFSFIFCSCDLKFGEHQGGVLDVSPVSRLQSLLQGGVAAAGSLKESVDLREELGEREFVVLVDVAFVGVIVVDIVVIVVVGEVDRFERRQFLDQQFHEFV